MLIVSVTDQTVLQFIFTRTFIVASFTRCSHNTVAINMTNFA